MRLGYCVPTAHRFPPPLDVMPEREGERLVSLRWLIQDISERKQAQDALQHSHDEMELRVRQRTADLETANQRLRDENARRTDVEDELRVALRARDALLREVRHRVKNNLQVICSLVDLQANQLESKQAPETLSDTSIPSP
jgi:two-component sensor histidine kinase